MWTPIDTQFYGPRAPVAIACLYDHGTASLFRSILEGLGAVTHLHDIGTPEDFLKVIGQEESAPPYLIISGHGGEKGIHFGEFMKGIDTSTLIGEDMPPSVIAGRVRVPGTFIVNICCGCGTQEMADAFLSGGASAYIGTDPDPMAFDHTVFISQLFHSIIRSKMTPFEAWQKAAVYDKATTRYHFFDAKGKHSLFEG